MENTAKGKRRVSVPITIEEDMLVRQGYLECIGCLEGDLGDLLGGKAEPRLILGLTSKGVIDLEEKACAGSKIYVATMIVEPRHLIGRIPTVAKNLQRDVTYVFCVPETEVEKVREYYDKNLPPKIINEKEDLMMVRPLPFTLDDLYNSDVVPNDIRERVIAGSIIYDQRGCDWHTNPHPYLKTPNLLLRHLTWSPDFRKEKVNYLVERWIIGEKILDFLDNDASVVDGNLERSMTDSAR